MELGSEGEMSRTRSVLGVVVGTVVLFLWYGLAQLFPWGVSTVNNTSATSIESYVSTAPGLVEAPPGTWTTQAFEERFGDGISTLATDWSFSLIVAVPRERYDMKRFFTLHMLALLGVAVFLVIAALLLEPLTRARRLAVVLVVGVAGSFGTYGEMMAWWGVPAPYGVGESANLVVGLLLAFLVVELGVLRSRAA